MHVSLVVSDTISYRLQVIQFDIRTVMYKYYCVYQNVLQKGHCKYIQYNIHKIYTSLVLYNYNTYKKLVDNVRI